MIELHDFYNDGFGWTCKRCESDLKAGSNDDHARFYREGEAESKNPSLATSALARWADPEQRTLICPRCGVTELADIS
jgi:rubrerythrin